VVLRALADHGGPALGAPRLSARSPGAMGNRRSTLQADAVSARTPSSLMPRLHDSLLLKFSGAGSREPADEDADGKRSPMGPQLLAFSCPPPHLAFRGSRSAFRILLAIRHSQFAISFPLSPRARGPRSCGGVLRCSPRRWPPACRQERTSRGPRDRLLARPPRPRCRSAQTSERPSGPCLRRG
jgi:hypothetical protein